MLKIICEYKTNKLKNAIKNELHITFKSRFITKLFLTYTQIIKFQKKNISAMKF